MRPRRLPPPARSSFPSTPPRSGSIRRPVLACSLVLLVAGLGVVSTPADAQQVFGGFAVDRFDQYSGTRSSLWLGVTPGFHRHRSFASGVGFGLAILSALRPAGSFATWATHRSRNRGHHRGWGHRRHDRFTYWGASCWDAVWDPYFWYWPECAPGWGYYPAYAAYPVSYYGHPYSPVHGWSFGIHLTFGDRWGSRGHSWGGYDRWGYGWDRYAWYASPIYRGFRTIYVDHHVNHGPRWRVNGAPRVARGTFSPGIGSGGWVSRTRFKEDPRSAAVPVRTAVARPRGQMTPAARAAATPDRAQASGARRPTVIRGTGSAPSARAPREQVAGDRRASLRGSTIPGVTSTHARPIRETEPRTSSPRATGTPRPKTRSRATRARPSEVRTNRAEPSRVPAARSELRRRDSGRVPNARPRRDGAAPSPSPSRSRSAADGRDRSEARSSSGSARSQRSARVAAPPRTSRASGGQARAAPRSAAPRASAPRASSGSRSPARRASPSPSRGSSSRPAGSHRASGRR